jgi:hypothetical protein
MLDQHERWVHFYTLTLQSIPLDAPNYTLSECVELLRKRFLDDNCYKLLERNTACIRITDLKFNQSKTVAAFLLQYSDSKVSDPAFSHLDTGKLREEPKLEGEGVAVSAHAILHMNPIAGKRNEFLFLLEDSPGLGRTKLVPFLNSQIKLVLTRDYIDPADGKKKVCWPNMELGHHISQTLREDLIDGELRFLELIKDVNVKELDEDPHVKRLRSTVQVKVTPKTYGDEAIGFINRIKNKYAKDGYADMKVVYRRPEGKQRTVDVSTFREDAGDVLFGKMEVFTSKEKLPQCAKDINVDVYKSMLKLK